MASCSSIQAAGSFFAIQFTFVDALIGESPDMRKPAPVSWFGLIALVLAAAGSFALGLGHVYAPELYCSSYRYQGVCPGMLLWFGMGSVLALLTMAKLFEDAMRYLDRFG